MSKLTWFEMYPPIGLDLPAVTGVLRPLASRPRFGLTRRTPIIVLELWSLAGHLHWLLGMDHRLSKIVPNQMQAQLAELVMVERTSPERPLPMLASTVHTTGITQRLRLDVAASVSAGLFDVLGSLGKQESAVLQLVLGPSQGRKVQPELFNLSRLLGLRQPPKHTARDENLWRQKASEPLFAIRLRVGASTALMERTSSLVAMLGDALALSSANQTQLRATRPSVRQARSLSNVYTTGNRWSAMLNAAEVATLAGWPLGGVEIPRYSRLRSSPAPPAMLVAGTKHHADVGEIRERILGVSLHPADGNNLVTMPMATALHHVHVTGVTGSGKSTLLASSVRSDIAAGQSVLVIEPRGDLVQDILAGVPPGRRDDVVVIEPGVGNRVVGINPLAGPVGDAERRADDLLHLFRLLYGKALGPRSSDVLLHSLIALSRLPDGTLADVPVLLTNGSFRRRVLTQVTDPLVLAPFFSGFDSLSAPERARVVAPVLNKTRAFLSRSAIRRLMGQGSPRFSVNELFTRQRIVLVNLNSGIIGAETASLIGAILVTQLWQEIQRRASVPATKRRPVAVVIDEVQNYLRLPVDVGDMLAQARGLGVSLTLAHQHLGQLNSRLQAAFLANARSKVVFRPSVGDQEPLARGLGGGLTPADLEGLGKFEAYVRLVVDQPASRPVAVRTLGLGDALSKPEQVRERSLSRYGIDGAELDRLLEVRWHQPDSQLDQPPGISERSAA